MLVLAPVPVLGLGLGLVPEVLGEDDAVVVGNQPLVAVLTRLNLLEK